jgi:hypothetical protein
MSGLDTSQTITDEASQHAKEMHVASRPHEDISGKSPLQDDSHDDETDQPAAEPAE